MADVIRYPDSSDPTTPIPLDWPQHHSNDLYSSTPENSTEGGRHVRDLHTKLENLIKGFSGSSGTRADQSISDLVQEILMVDVVLQEKYSKLALADLIKKNKIVKGKDGLPLLSAAIGILEKYGRNLLKSSRPSQWKTISFSNAVFRTRVDIIKGARDILNLLGYTEVVVDGVCFPDMLEAPDSNTVAMVTADLILAKAEIDAYTKHNHPHPDRVTECVEGTVAAIRYPPSEGNSANNDSGGTVYVRQSARHSSSPKSDIQQPIVPRSETQLQKPTVVSVSPPMQTSRILSRQPVVQPMQHGRYPMSQPVVQTMQPGKSPTQHPGQAVTASTHPGTHQRPPYAPKPAWIQDPQSAATGAASTSQIAVSSTPANDHLVCTICGQDSATKECNTCPERLRCEQCDMQWHKHPSRKSHQRRDIYPVIHDPPLAEPEGASSPCSVCGDNQAMQHCQQCNADYCEACGKKMHLHPKRKNHTLQPLPGRNTVPEPTHQTPPMQPQLPDVPNSEISLKRLPPDGRSVRGSLVEEPVARLSHLAIRRPESFDNQVLNTQPQDMSQSPRISPDQQQVGQGNLVHQHQKQAPYGQMYKRSPVEQHQAAYGQGYQRHPVGHSVRQQQTAQAEFQTPLPTQRRRPVPKPRMSLGQSPTSPSSHTGEFERHMNTASLSTNVSHERVANPASPNADPRELEMQTIMSQDVSLLERITEMRNNLKRLPRNTPQFARLEQMERSLWDEHKELLDRQAVLEQSLKGPSLPPPVKRGQSMMAEIRRPPVGLKSLSVIPDEDSSPQISPGHAKPMLSPRSQSARRPQEGAGAQTRPPADGWECNPCGFVNNGDRYNCEDCGAPYIATNNTNQPRQGPMAGYNMGQTGGGGQIIKTPPQNASKSIHQQAKTLQDDQLPVGIPLDNKTPAKSTPWNCQSCTYSNQADADTCQMCGTKKILDAVTSGPPLPPLSSTSGEMAPPSIPKTPGQRHIQMAPPSSPKTPVQRQQTEDEKKRPLDKPMTAYEYMQQEEEDMLKEKFKAKALDEAQQKSSSEAGQSHAIYDTLPRRPSNTPPRMPSDTPPRRPSDTPPRRPSDTPPRIPSDTPPRKPPRQTAALSGAAASVPPAAPVIKQRENKPEPLTSAIEMLKINQLEGDRSAKDVSGDGLPSSSLSPSSMNLQLTQERRILAEQATDGLAFVNILRQAETNDFCVEDVTVASMAIQETQAECDIVPWLQQNWDDYKSTATAQATNALNRPGSSEWIQLSEVEVVEALYKHDGHIEEVVNECVAQRNQKIAELESYGFETAEAAKAISVCDGNVDKALMKLQEPIVSPVLDRLWDPDEEDTVLYQKLANVPSDHEEHESYLRLILAEFNISSWGRAITAARLISNNKYQTKDAITAASECGDYERAKQFLEKECHVCYGEFPHNQLMSLSHCQGCLICSECLAGHFKIVIQTRNIMHATCPACNKPDSKDATELAEYFTFLDSWLRTLLDDETHALFQHKLRDWNLQKEENFRWCAHCRNGFINEAPERRKMRCPECGNITCFNCKKSWMDQHENISCLEFEQWKQDNDPEKQAEGVAYHLRENGIACPQCKMRYELAKGGCMHFKCTQCMFNFCCGCNKPFINGAECGKFPSCANRGLHSHHPRDCLFHLRDWVVPDLQKLLQNHQIPYDTKPPKAQGNRPDNGCRVMEQKETPEGLDDGPCGRDAPALHAGLCRIHYLEYLVGLINQNMVDPAETFTPDELGIVLKRNEIAVPARPQGGALIAYQQTLLATVQEKLPFDGKPPRERP